MLSLIIVTWNCRKQIEACLESLRQQDYGDYEIVIIDQASKDGTAEYLRSVPSQFNLRLLLRSTKGSWAINNMIGISMAKGEWLAVSNPDIIFPEGSLKRIMNEAERVSRTYNGPKPFLGCQLISPDGSENAHPIRQLSLETIFHAGVRLGVFLDRKLWRRYFEKRFYYDTNGVKDPVKVDHLNASFFMVHRETVTRMGRLWGDEYRWACADSDMFMRARSKSIHQVFYHDIRLIHEAGHSRKFTPSPEIDYEFAYGFIHYARDWQCHPNILRGLFFLDALATPFVLLLGRFDGIRNQIRCSAARLQGILH
jgi:GT2 family glycosyltransferase